VAGACLMTASVPADLRDLYFIPFGLKGLLIKSLLSREIDSKLAILWECINTNDMLVR